MFLKKGSKEITEKISISEKISFEKAENIKESKIIGKKTDNIFIQEINKIFENILKEIKLSNKEHIFPGGITIVGGGSKLLNIEKILKNILVMPVKKPLSCLQDNITDYHAAYGNILLGMKEHEGGKIKLKNILPSLKKVLKKFSL